MSENPSAFREELPVILAAAVAQGWALFGLHHAISAHIWPSTNLPWLFALYAVAVLIPLTTQLLAVQVRKAASWTVIGLMTLLLFYFGWHHGARVSSFWDNKFAHSGECFPLAIVLLVLWMLLMPFVQARFETGRWTAEYRQLFTHAWRNVMVLGEAAVFTALFWLLLFLWQSLFHMLQIDFFRDLFEKPIFVYPVTSLVFGCALHLIGSIERFIATVLEQILNVFKWLGTVTAVLLALFSVALISRLPGLIVTGQKAIGASWLLWLSAVVVLFLNAAYRDGTVDRPYPKWVMLCLRFVMPLTVVVTLTAIFALYVRTGEYGLTVERVWAFIVAGAALIYSLGYSAAALRKGPWFAAVSKVNVTVAIALISVISLSLTPVLSPYRLAADSQYSAILKGRLTATAGPLDFGSPFHYLRFNSGEYGRHRLDELVHLKNHPDADRIHRLAAEWAQLSSPYDSVPTELAREALLRMVIYPSQRALDADLSDLLTAELNDVHKRYVWLSSPRIPLAGVFAHLSATDSDSEAFVLLNGSHGVIYQRGVVGWREVGHTHDAGLAVSQDDLLENLRKGQVAVKDPLWKDLWIGSHHIRIE